MTDKTTTIDAAGQSLGRVASAAAKALMGKTRADYVPHASSDTSVQITNASKLKVRDTKMASQQYQNYSGYPGGQRIETLRSLSARKGYGAAIRLAVQRMLPNNSLRTGRLKRLHISE
jgi:large subunit ribosomal protein L13